MKRRDVSTTASSDPTRLRAAPEHGKLSRPGNAKGGELLRRKRKTGVTAGSETDGSAGRLITLTEAAFRLGRVHRTTVMRWVKEGKLRCVRLSRKAIMFEPAELDRFIRVHRCSG